MLARVITASLGIPLLVYVATARSFVPAVIFALLLSLLCTVEIVQAARGKRAKFPLSLQIVSRLPYALFLLAVVFNWTVDQLLLYGSIAGVLGLIIAVIFRVKGTGFPPYALWIALPTACVIAVRVYDTRSTDGLAELQFGTALLMLFLCLWAGDTAAFAVGKTMGRHKLAPAISPKKTWEGAAANIIAAIAVGGAAAQWCGLSVPLGIAIGAIVGIAGQAGDLYESAWKRSLGIKDSGNLLPGHGGFLDRFDSLLFAAPPVATLLYSGWLK